MPIIIRSYKKGTPHPHDAWGQFVSGRLTEARFIKIITSNWPGWRAFSKKEFLDTVRPAKHKAPPLSGDAVFMIWTDDPEVNEWGEVAP